jgi:uncharacterized protein (TIGR00251 family)
MEPLDLRTHKLGSTLRLAVRPGAPRTAALGVHGGALRLAVAAPPEKGRANREALRWLSRALGLPAAAVELLAGETDRHKVALCRGMGAEALRAKLATLLLEGGER